MKKRYASLDRYLDANATLREKGEAAGARPRPFVTISREAGAGGHVVGSRLVDLLNRHAGQTPWTLIDRNLVDVIMAQHGLPENVGRYLEERKQNAFEELVADLLGMRPGSDTLVRKTNATLIALAQMGNCVLVGRGANFATRRLDSGFHVRLVAARLMRVRRVEEVYPLEGRQAVDVVKQLDADRQAYIRSAFDRDVTDPLAYDCLINTTGMSFDDAAGMLASHVRAM